ncbi:MAG TPA: tetratricopeptide repeat protein [Vicinamibacterales bacterium]|nr:tetratricopeptide repeat protein [Vicinamibacterales bacterium]
MSRTVVLGAIVATAFVAVATIKDARTTAVAERSSPRIVGALDTSRDRLAITVKEMTARVALQPDNATAVVGLAEALLRMQRVNQDDRSGRAAIDRLDAFLSRHPNHYEAARWKASALVSQHRFTEGIGQANRLIARDPRDGWNYGVLGDAYLELGDYEQAFAAFDRMGALQPGPPAYARVAYALELKGDLQGAVEYMQRAADGTTSNDTESQAWHFSQLGMLYLQQGKRADATREFERALATFPSYPAAIEGLARVRVAGGELKAARTLYREQFARTPATHLAAAVGDLSAALGDAADARRYYEMAAQIERGIWANGPRQPQVMSRLLSERGHDLATSLSLAEEAAARQRDIFTMDTLAWACFKSGMLAEAARYSTEALRTGSRDARLLYHAAAIRFAAGDAANARALLDRLPSRDMADVLIAAGVEQLERSLRQ